VEVPSDANQMRALVGKFLSIDDPVYVRIGRGPVPVIYNENCDVEIGKAITWFDGTDAAIIACGQMVWRALEAAKELEKRVSMLPLWTCIQLNLWMKRQFFLWLKNADVY